MNGVTGTITVLHVDDDPDIADLAATFLEREDDRITVRTATDAEAGLSVLAEGDVDCVVSDFDMPATDGLGFLEAVREDYGDLPFILYTGKGSEEVASDAVSAGVTDYMQKETGTDQYAVLANRVVNAVGQYRAEQEAERHRRRLSELSRATDDCLWMFDRDWEELLFVSGYEAVWGRPESAIREDPRDFLEGVHPDDREFVRDAMERLSAGESVDIEYRIVRGDGEQGSVWVKGDPVFDDDGNVVRVVGFTRDITPREEREQELEETAAVLSTLVGTLSVGVIVEDESREVMVANDRLCELFDLSDPAADLAGADCKRLVREVSDRFVDPARFVSRTDDLVATWESVYGEEFELRDGRVFARSHEPVELPDGNGHLWVYREVTDQRTRERRLRETSPRLEALFEQSPDMIDVHDGEGRLVDVNPRLVEETGYGKSELTGMEVWDLDEAIDPDEARAMWAEMDYGDRERFEGVYRRADGRTFPVEVHLRRLALAGEDRFLAISRDVTERTERERELERQNKRLEEFASVVSHDLRNPLNVASGRLELLEEEYESNHIGAIERAHDRMESLIEDLLALARENEDETKPVALAPLCGSCWRNVETETATLRVETDRVVRADEGRLKQLFENLVRNAVEHGGEGVTVTVGELDGGFHVADDGPGIPPEERDSVFEAGYSTATDGTGFGLSIIRDVAETHDWDVDLAESDDGGARFEFTGVAFADD